LVEKKEEKKPTEKITFYSGFLFSLQMQKCKNAKWQVGHYHHSRLLIDDRWLTDYPVEVKDGAES